MKLINLECAKLAIGKDEGERPELNDIMDVCIRFDGIEVDLHNNYDFAGFSYDAIERSAIFKWKGSLPETADNDYDRAMPKHFAIRFNNVWEFSMTPRDPAYPPESDLGTDFLYLSEVGWQDAEKKPDWPEGVANQMFVIGFANEAEIMIHAESLERIEPAS